MNDLSPITPEQAALEVEQQVIGYLLHDVDVARQIVATVDGSDFADNLHREAFEIVKAGFRKGRENPGRELIVAALGNQDVADDLKLRDYLVRATNAVVVDAYGKWRDAVEEFREMAARRKLASLGRSLTAYGDVGAMLDAARASIDDLTNRRRKGKVASYSAHEAARAAIAAIGEPDTAITTGYADLDVVLGGWPREELSVVAARPGMGKSAFATGAAMRAAKVGAPTLFFSLEMHGKQLGSRLIADLAYTANEPIHYEAILKGRIDERQMRRVEEASAMLKGLPMRIEEQRGLTIAEIQARTRQAVSTSERNGNRLGLVVIDHMGLVRPSDRYEGNRTREVAEISDGLATLAKDLGIAVVALSQLNRGVEGRDNKRPSLSDLRDSGAIEEDASNVLFLYRPAYYLEKRTDDSDMDLTRSQQLEATKHSLEIVVAKNRNGRIGSVDLYIDVAANALRSMSVYRP